MSVIEDRLALLESLYLGSGGHESWEKGACIMEAVAYVSGEPWSDHPKCASPVLTRFCMTLNDRLNDDDRQLLKPYVVRLVGTNTGKADDETRAWMALNWLLHEYAPARLRLAGRTEEAERFEQLVTVASRADWEAIRPVVREIRDEMRALRDQAFKRLRENAADADAAVAVADAADAAAAVADAAVAAAVAVAVAVAVAAAAADAAVAAVAVAVADAAAAADEYRAVYAEALQAASGQTTYVDRWNAAYKVLRPFWDERVKTLDPGLRESVFGLLDRMIEVGKP